MQIRKLEAFDVCIELRKPIRHASHVRDSTRNLLIRCELSDGSIGWGEGLPRPYVTGDSIETAWSHLSSTDFSAMGNHDISDGHVAASAVQSLQLADVAPEGGVTARECFGNPVRCALELALLDATGRSTGRSLGELITQFPEAEEVACPVESVRYSGAITSGTPVKQMVSAAKMKLFGFHQVKVKVGAKGIDDASCLRRVRRVLGRRVDLRLDANEAWSADQVLSRMEPLLKFAPTSLEQPVPHDEVATIAAVRRQLSVPIMLDESLCCMEDARRALDGGWCDIFNIRLSKCGGILPAVQLAKFATDAKLSFQLGCQVGESGVLSAAGRHFACNIAGARYLEGSYDRFLVRQRLTREDLTFGYGGRALRIQGHGLGITVDEQQMERICRRKQTLLA